YFPSQSLTSDHALRSICPSPPTPQSFTLSYTTLFRSLGTGPLPESSSRATESERIAMAFKVADGYVEIHVRYDRGKLNKSVEDAATQAGNRFSDRFQRSTERGMKKNLAVKNFMQREAGPAGQSAAPASALRRNEIHAQRTRQHPPLRHTPGVALNRRAVRRYGQPAAASAGGGLTPHHQRSHQSRRRNTPRHLVMMDQAAAASRP